jgi:hypothetical protein
MQGRVRDLLIAIVRQRTKGAVFAAPFFLESNSSYRRLRRFLDRAAQAHRRPQHESRNVVAHAEDRTVVPVAMALVPLAARFRGFSLRRRLRGPFGARFALWPRAAFGARFALAMHRLRRFGELRRRCDFRNDAGKARIGAASLCKLRRALGPLPASTGLTISTVASTSTAFAASFAAATAFAAPVAVALLRSWEIVTFSRHDVDGAASQLLDRRQAALVLRRN